MRSAVLMYKSSTLRPARMTVSFLSGLLSELFKMRSTLFWLTSAPTCVNKEGGGGWSNVGISVRISIEPFMRRGEVGEDTVGGCSF